MRTDVAVTPEEAELPEGLRITHLGIFCGHKVTCAKSLRFRGADSTSRVTASTYFGANYWKLVRVFVEFLKG